MSLCLYINNILSLLLFPAIPVEDAMCNDNIAIVVPSRGGHIGFLEGLFPRQQSYMDRLYSQFVNAVFTYGTAAFKKD